MSNIKMIPEFFISKNDWKKIIQYAESSYRQFKAEIGGQCVVVEDAEGNFWLKEPVILKQEVSGGNCEMEEAELAIHYGKMADKYGDDVRHCWWHSHHTMGAFWSGTDHNTIMENETDDFSVSLVVNLKQEYKLRVQMFYPIEAEVNVTLNIEDEIPQSKAIDKEVADKCEKETAKVITYGGKNGYGHSKAQRELFDYNYGFSYGHTVYDNDCDFKALNSEQYTQLMKYIDELAEKFYDNKISFQEYKKEVNDANKKLKKHNLRIKNLKSHELATFAMGNFAEDFFENIKEVN
tara:strand:- start:2760 stop:3638 length:879 start_codon:yes stop_codon:yes gene_type:complete